MNSAAEIHDFWSRNRTPEEIRAAAETLGIENTLSGWSDLVRARRWGLGVWIGEWEEGFIAGKPDGLFTVQVFTPDPRRPHMPWDESWEDGEYVEDASLEIALATAVIRAERRFRGREEERAKELSDDAKRERAEAEGMIARSP